MDIRDLPTGQALNLLADPYSRIHFSQFGEDVIVWSLLQTLGKLESPGFYVDVGACHPTFGSNTKMLNLMGWRGVNIDVNADNIVLFERDRPNDVNVVAAISDQQEELEFSIYEGPALTTADPELRRRHDAMSPTRRIERIVTRTLADVLNEAVSPGQKVDLFSIDVEGYDEKALRSNDWDRFAPLLLLVEDHAISLVGEADTPIHRFLTGHGYRLASLAFVTSIYIRDRT